jgi:hypothetical protein
MLVVLLLRKPAAALASLSVVLVARAVMDCLEGGLPAAAAAAAAVSGGGGGVVPLPGDGPPAPAGEVPRCWRRKGEDREGGLALLEEEWWWRWWRWMWRGVGGEERRGVLVGGAGVVGPAEDRRKTLAMMELPWLRRWALGVSLGRVVSLPMSLAMEMGMEPPVSGVPMVWLLGLLSSESESKSNVLRNSGSRDGDGEADCWLWKR